jgi:hypothetical protein
MAVKLGQLWQEQIVFWTDMTYLNRGSERQRNAFRVLIELDLFSVLAEFDPVLAGTFPLGLETAQSDLDILCNAESLDRFAELVTLAYGDQDEFAIHYTEKNGLPTAICNFRTQGIPVELFAQSRPTEEQNGYRHLVAEARLLREGGEEAVHAIRDLKLEGMKTEPAFGHYFCLSDDPYEALLALADVSADELSEVVIQAKIARRKMPMRLSAILEG